VKKTWLNAAKTVLRWAVEHKLVPRNVFADVRVTVPKKKKLREGPALTATEARTILRAASAITETRKPASAAKRWVPWLCAYTGARPGEITQLRAEDVVTRDDVHALRLTPEAGAIKGGRARIVPLHEHIVEQGFLDFVASVGKGPLFYLPAKKPDNGSPTQRKKPRAAQARQRLAAWVRTLGVDDRELSPNHGWRHTFRQVASRHDIPERMIDFICGWTQANVGRDYGPPTLEDMAMALRKFPRYEMK
jgi:integrase